MWTFGRVGSGGGGGGGMVNVDYNFYKIFLSRTIYAIFSYRAGGGGVTYLYTLY